jgi:hypothetical protein
MLTLSTSVGPIEARNIQRRGTFGLVSALLIV